MRSKIVFLGKDNKKFQISKIRKGARNREYVGTVEWLRNAGIGRDPYPDIQYGIKLANKNIGFNGKFYTFPYFMAFLLKRFLRENQKKS